ncbi:MAG: hypothetical protein ACK45E_07635, partial [Ignavibacteria bacterium]
YYTSPIQDLTCLRENGSTRSSATCNTADAADGSKFYGIHWERPQGWSARTFDDSDWPFAIEYPNNEVGVDNKPAYTNFADVFDNAMNDAQFIWSSNLILDNEVLMRYTLPGTTSVEGEEQSAIIAPNPATDVVRVHLPVSEIRSVDLFDVTGQRESVMIGSDGMI